MKNQGVLSHSLLVFFWWWGGGEEGGVGANSYCSENHENKHMITSCMTVPWPTLVKVLVAVMDCDIDLI
jgi:hypothetical protein